MRGLLLAAFFIAAGAPAHGACARWSIGGVSLQQSNNVRVTLKVERQGDNILGTADYFYIEHTRPLGAYAATDHLGHGTVDGTLIGGKLEMQISWTQPGDGDRVTTGIYSGVIDDQGRISGKTYDFLKPTSRADFIAESRADCEPSAPPTAPPPIHRLGKRKPSAPVSPADVTRAKVAESPKGNPTP